MNIFNVNAEVADIEVALGSVAQVLQDWESGRPHRLDLSTVVNQSVSINQQVGHLRSQANLDGDAIIHSTRPGVGPWIIRFQLFVRRLTWWFTEPIIFQIRMFQNQAVTIITKLSQNDQQLTQSFAAMQEELSDLKERLSALESRRIGDPEGACANKDDEKQQQR